jgi:hypothetical protein
MGATEKDPPTLEAAESFLDGCGKRNEVLRCCSKESKRYKNPYHTIPINLEQRKKRVEISVSRAI